MNSSTLDIAVNTPEDNPFYDGEYQSLILSRKLWSLFEVSGEEDVDEASMNAALTWSFDGKTVLMFSWFVNNTCSFDMRFPTDDNIGHKTVKIFTVDSYTLNTTNLTSSSLISYLTKGIRLSIDSETAFGIQEYSLAGSSKVLSGVATIADNIKLTS